VKRQEKMNLIFYPFFSVSLTLLPYLAYLIGTSNAATEIITLPSACNDLSNGDHYLQPLSQEEYESLTGDSSSKSPVVLATCYNGYTIVNPKQDSNFEKLFSSYHTYHSTYAGPNLNDHVTWQEWLLPSRLDEDMIFSVSEDCQTCLSYDDLEYGDDTVYYMTGDSYGCNWPLKNLCDFDADTLECYQCTASGATATDTVDTTNMYGKCGHMPATSYSTVNSDHSWCTEHTGGSQPSIGTINRFCVCYKPSTYQTNTVDEETLNYHIEETKDTEFDIFNEDAVRVVYLTQEDFQFGTYRITDPGTYIIQEDIEFDFNSGDINDPNAEGSWYPTSDQEEDYPGAGSYDGWYWLGFFAGITIEASNVILDLNGHELKQSPAFYLQQRWFVNVVLGNKAFLDGQGPTWTGTGFQETYNTVIKNGILGLTSHIGIHGSNCTDITLQDLVVRNFETHGIIINEHYNLKILNVEVGPSVNGQLGLNGMYSLARISLPVMRSAASQMGDETITFGTRGPYSFSELVDNLAELMDLAFKWAYFGEEGTGSTWETAYQLFANPSGVSPSGAVYGMVLRPRGASVFNYGKYSGGTSNTLYMENVNIHDLIVAPNEIVAVGTHWNTWVRDTFNAPVPFQLAVDNNLDPVGEAHYTGNPWTDCVVALRYFSNDWWYLGRLAMPDDVVEWATSGESFDDVVTVNNECNFDTLGHVMKGVVGLKMEYLENSYIKDLAISNLINIGSLGSTVCGAYQDGKDGGMPLQDKLTNQGYGGATARALSLYEVTSTTFENIQVENVVSFNGPSHGMYLYDTCDVEIKEGVFKHITGGIMNEEDYSKNQWPNPAAEGCALSALDLTVFSNVENVESTCVSGHTNCMRCAVLNSHSCTGTVSDCDEETTYSTPYGTISVTSDGSVTMEYSTDIAYSPIVESSLFQNSNAVNLHKKQYHAIIATKQSNFQFKIFLLCVATIMILIIGYYSKKRKQNVSKNNNIMTNIISNGKHWIISQYDKIHTTLADIKNWATNGYNEDDNASFNFKNRITNLFDNWYHYYHNSANEINNANEINVNNSNNNNNGNEYLSIDDCTSLHYQEAEFLLSQQ